jgi:L-seryl-tRNA(Ser) seleniumtransferase
MPTNLLRNLPSVSELLETAPLKGLVEKVNQNVLVSRVRTALDDLKHEVQSAAADVKLPNVNELAQRIAQYILSGQQAPLRPVINATGVLLPKGLGRAPLADEAITELTAVARDYASVEFDLATGSQRPRLSAVEGLLTQLTGAEAALVVNNGAGATLLALAATAGGREVVVSRGHLIEMGSSYRLPEIITASGATIREIGTTNRTHAEDYARAIGEKTGAILLVHPGNFIVSGCTASVGLEELVRLSRTDRVPVIHTIGSGALIDVVESGVNVGPLLSTSVKQGADLVVASGDKLLGGPQCGIILGKRALIEQLAAHPLARALRVDKLVLAALVATLRLYRDPATARNSIPLLRLLNTPLENLKLRAERLAPQMAESAGIRSAGALERTTYLGGASVPGEEVKTWCIALRPTELGVERLAARLRTGSPAVVARVETDAVLLDLRSVFPRQDEQLVAAVLAAGKAE